MGVYTMLDEKSMENLKNLSDTQLRELITVIAQAAGADGGKAAALLSNTESLRRTIATMSPAQAEGFIKAAGKDFPKAGVTARNIPMTSEMLRKKLGCNDGDEAHIFGLKSDTEGMLLIIGHKIKKQ